MRQRLKPVMPHPRRRLTLPPLRRRPRPRGPISAAASSRRSSAGRQSRPTSISRSSNLYQPAQPDYAAHRQPPAIRRPAMRRRVKVTCRLIRSIPNTIAKWSSIAPEEKPGTIVIDTPNKFLYLVEDGGKAMRYGIGVGRPGFTWAGVKTISAKKEWPDWRPPSDMLQRRPDHRRAITMPGGIDNPLGARAMYPRLDAPYHASTAQTNDALGPSAPTSRPVAFVCGTKMSPISTAACRSAPRSW